MTRTESPIPTAHGRNPLSRFASRPLGLALVALVALAACSSPPAPPPAPAPNTFESTPLPQAVTPGFDQADPVDAVRERFEANLSGPSTPLPVPGDADDAPGPALDDDKSGSIVGKNLITSELTTRQAVPADSPMPPLPAPDIPELEPGAAPSRLRPQDGTLLDRVTFLSRAQTQRVKLESSFPNRSPSGPYGCSGTLIDSQWLLTAAHCVYHFDEAGSAQNGYANTVR